jgi:hypothetical protein
MIEGGGSKTLSKAKEWIFKYPKESHELLGRITDVCVDFLVGQVHAGAQVRSFTFISATLFRLITQLAITDYGKIYLLTLYLLSHGLVDAASVRVLGRRVGTP